MKKFEFDEFATQQVVDFYESRESHIYYGEYKDGTLTVCRIGTETIEATYTGFLSFEQALGFIKEKTHEIVDCIELKIANPELYKVVDGMRNEIQ
jgi:hypothetical protein